jgi:hypothetical protein
MACPDGFWCMQFKDWLNVGILIVTVLAIVAGPIVAVRLTLRFELSREKLRRKYETFHALMKTRRVTLSLEHVTALNVIQTEFHDDDKVISAYKKYIDNLGGPPLPNGATPDAIRKFLEQRDDVFNEMMFEIGRILDLHWISGSCESILTRRKVGSIWRQSKTPLGSLHWNFCKESEPCQYRHSNQT